MTILVCRSVDVTHLAIEHVRAMRSHLVWKNVVRYRPISSAVGVITRRPCFALLSIVQS